MLTLFVIIISLAVVFASCDSFVLQPPWCLYQRSSYHHHHQQQQHNQIQKDQSSIVTTSINMVNNDETQEQVMEALNSLGDFHVGTWTGKATSFTVTADVAAGIVQKKISPNYEITVNLGYTTADDNDDDDDDDEKDSTTRRKRKRNKEELAIVEMMTWEDENDNNSKVFSRTLPFSISNVDVDAVDASYSLDTTKPNLPFAIIGTSKKVHFAVEQCLAISDDERIRSFALYGENHNLVRVVLCEEKRIKDTTKPSSSASLDSTGIVDSELLEMQGDLDRLVDKIADQVQGISSESKDGSTPKPSVPNPTEQFTQQRLERLQKAISDNSSSSSGSGSLSSDDDASRCPSLSKHPMSLLELSSGVWLGDAIIRDYSQDDKGRTSTRGNSSVGKGFGPRKLTTASTPPSFGNFEMGVQKVARQCKWNFGEDIQVINEVGKALGAEIEPALGQSIFGSVCENQSLSRRIPKEDRMVYIDWNNGNGDNHVAFLLGSASIQVPRFCTSRESANRKQSFKPFSIELCVYQSETEEENIEASSPMSPSASLSLDDDTPPEDFPEICCSRISRVYNTDGHIKQGCTSFYTFQRFGTELDQVE